MDLPLKIVVLIYLHPSVVVNYGTRTVFHPFRRPLMAGRRQSFLCGPCPPLAISGRANHPNVAEWVLWYESLGWLLVCPIPAQPMDFRSKFYTRRWP